MPPLLALRMAVFQDFSQLNFTHFLPLASQPRSRLNVIVAQKRPLFIRLSHSRCIATTVHAAVVTDGKRYSGRNENGSNTGNILLQFRVFCLPACNVET
jgi:hypothetical protein